MRIGIEAQRIFRPKKHGMDVVAIELIKNLQQLDNQNEFVVLAKDKNDGTLEASPNFRIDQFPALSYVDWEQIQLPKAIKRNKLDLLHCTANTAPLYSSIPVVLTLHDIIYLENVDFKGTAYQNLGNLYRRFVVPKIVHKVKLVLTVSEFEKDNIVTKLRLPEEKVQVLYNGVSPVFNTHYSREQIDTFQKKYQLPAHYIMFLGNTAPKKNTLNVIKAYVDFCLNEKTEIPLVLLDYKKELVVKILEELNQPGLIDRFIFPGYIPYSQIPLMYHGATIFLYPSLRESFGLPILEAMACGVPVITSTTSSMPEVAGEAAILIDPFNYKDLSAAIQQLVRDETLRQDCRQKGLQRVQSFTWRASADKLKEFYKRLG